MQFTGIRDRSGKDIYEGDIVEYYSAGIKQRAVVHYLRQYACFGVGEHTALHAIPSLEVIGNIFANPDGALLDCDVNAPK